MTCLDTRLQRMLESVYRIDGALNVADFRIAREAMQSVLPMRPETRESLLVHHSEDVTHLALFICDEVMDRAAAFFAALSVPGQGLHQHLDAMCVATEGVSHFVYFTFCGERQERAVSQVELELQAEIDKYLVLRTVCGLGGEALIEALFEDFQLDAQLSFEEAARYQTANRAARRYARWLDRALREAAPHALNDARDLYRKPMSEKLEHIERRAA